MLRAVFDGARSEVELEHAHVVADIEHAGAIAIGLGDEQPPFSSKSMATGFASMGSAAQSFACMP
jgi:hypothetical protein